MSLPLTKCCGSPPVTLVVPLVVERGVGIYSLTSGAAGFLKLGPTAQPASSTASAAVMENMIRMDSVKGHKQVRYSVCPGGSVERQSEEREGAAGTPCAPTFYPRTLIAKHNVSLWHHTSNRSSGLATRR